ncbi:translational elongation factor EF-1 alpha [Chytridiales sp. JEL 0842]|nr:translational elongation factor EF-1 alpha [Chytridiales sp. JEL 0842]
MSKAHKSVAQITDLFKTLTLNTTAAPDRQNAASDLAKVVASAGTRNALLSKDLNVLEKLKKAAEDKKNPQAREGAMLAYTALAKAGIEQIKKGGDIDEPALLKALPTVLTEQGDKVAAVKAAADAAGIALIDYVKALTSSEKSMTVAQPYLVKELPAILAACGEKKPSKNLKIAAQEAVAAIAKAVSTNAFRDMIPALIDGQDAFKSKTATRIAALTALSAFSDTAPEQLGFALTEIVPEISKSVVDTDLGVSEAAEKALTAACEVISNRDLEHMTVHIVRSITHPNEVVEIMHKLAGVTFVQSVESPALAMITPLLLRGLNSGATATVRQAAVIIDNVSRLVNDPLDAAPFMGLLIPALEKATETLSNPEARSVAERTLAAMQKLNILVEKEKARQKYIELDQVIAAIKQKITVPEGHTGHDDIFLHHVGQICCSLMSLRKFDADSWKEVTRFLSVIDPKAANDIDALRTECEAMVKPLPAQDEDDDDEGEELCNCVFTLAYGTKILLHNTPMKLKRGAKYGLLGGNDSGKTTLMRSIANGSVEGFPDSNQVRTVFVEADILGELSHLSCVDYVMQDPRLAGLKREEIISVLNSVGFTDNGKAKPNHAVSTLSGGWRMKLALARAMLQKADILLLDEPTNHLDVINVKWVINYINSLTNVTCIMVSHDSNFLNSTCTNIIQIDRLKLHQFKGNLSSFIEKNPDAKSYFSLKETKLTFRFPEPGPIEGIKSRSKALMKMVNCSFTYPGNTVPTLFDITIQVSMASRVGCVGENGAGKSTMIKVLTGEVVPQTGDVWKHPNARIAYVAQHAFHHIEKHLDKTANEYIRWRYADGTDKESLVKVSMVLTEEEKKLQATPIQISWKGPDGKLVNGKKQVREVTGLRRQQKNEFEYEVVFMGETRSAEGVYLDASTLTKMGWEKEVKAIDTRIAQAAGQYVRTLSSANVESHLGDVGLSAEFATHYRMQALSGGQKVKVVMAAALWNQPHILILDEPTNYLDREALGALAKAIEEFGGGVVIISHNNEFVSTICKEEWLMDAGHLTTKGESGGWMDKAADKIDDQEAITHMVDVFGNKEAVKQKKKMSKREEKMFAKKIKEKIDANVDLDDDEYEYAAANNMLEKKMIEHMLHRPFFNLRGSLSDLLISLFFITLPIIQYTFLIQCGTTLSPISWDTYLPRFFYGTQPKDSCRAWYPPEPYMVDLKLAPNCSLDYELSQSLFDIFGMGGMTPVERRKLFDRLDLDGDGRLRFWELTRPHVFRRPEGVEEEMFLRWDPPTNVDLANPNNVEISEMMYIVEVWRRIKMSGVENFGPLYGNGLDGRFVPDVW